MRAYEEMDEAAESAAEHAPSYSAALKNILDALIPLGDRHGFLAHFGLEDDAELKNEIARQAEETRDLIDAARGEGLFDPAIPTSWIERMYDAAVMAGWESMRAEETTLNQASELAWNSLIKGVGAKS
ncbi:hypothetical protein [Maricaulis sp.]|uniref:hypothetical protein n=1 Tax=Maricaulis sp. TaxID=1486257 RepID=UPI0025BC58CD|nr:hypothetical protein [Maricaulis sp.]